MWKFQVCPLIKEPFYAFIKRIALERNEGGLLRTRHDNYMKLNELDATFKSQLITIDMKDVDMPGMTFIQQKSPKKHD